MLIKSIVGNTLTVVRGKDGTLIESHINGSYINLINSTDDDLIEQTDDFGFNEYRYDYNDGKVYSPSKGIDV